MTNKDINKEAYKQAEQQLLDNKVKEVKQFILETLEKIESKKKDKERIEEELRVLKLDLEDLRNGNFDKMQERQEKSQVARKVSVQMYSNHTHSMPVHTTRYWIDSTSGTYTLTNGTNYYF